MQRTKNHHRPKKATATQGRAKKGQSVGNGAKGHRMNTGTARVDKYLALARAAEAEGDVVMSHSYYQHAEHYLRQMQGNRGRYGKAGQATPSSIG